MQFTALLQQMPICFGSYFLKKYEFLLHCIRKTPLEIYSDKNCNFT